MSNKGFAALPVYRVRRFTEKPDLPRAKQFIASGNYAWNSGIFLWSARTLANAIREHRPAIAPHLAQIAAAYGTPNFDQVFAEQYPKCESISIDYAVLEPRSAKGEGASEIYCLPADFEWNDLGSWAALYEHCCGDTEGTDGKRGRGKGARCARIDRQLRLRSGEDCRSPGSGGSRCRCDGRCSAGNHERALAGRWQGHEGTSRSCAGRLSLSRRGMAEVAGEVKFGTDGWRGIIADDFTYANVRVAARAIAHYVLEQEDASRGVCIGYDTRFGSRSFAKVVASVMSEAGISVALANGITPTPALSYAVRDRGAAGGVMITSSHNPAEWNGVKYKASYGGSGKPSIIAAIEGYLHEPLPVAASRPRSRRSTFCRPYLAALESFVDLGAIRASGYKFLIDCMYGAGRGVIAGIFSACGYSVCGDPQRAEPGLSGHQSGADPAAHQRIAGSGCGGAMRCGADHGWGRGPHRRSGRARQVVDAHKIFAVILRVAAGAQGVAGGCDARLQHDQDAGPDRGQAWADGSTSMGSGSSMCAT